jgi:hypothetical protein
MRNSTTSATEKMIFIRDNPHLTCKQLAVRLHCSPCNVFRIAANHGLSFVKRKNAVIVRKEKIKAKPTVWTDDMAAY